MESIVLLTLLGTGLAFLSTSLGSGLVFFCKTGINPKLHRFFMGLASGVMMAASIWSLIMPAMERAEELEMIVWLPAAGGIILGCGFIWMFDRIICHLEKKKADDIQLEQQDHKLSSHTKMMLTAVTLHNIPEGMAIGLAFALAVKEVNNPLALAGAISLTIGIAVQNFPEGAAISLPLRQEGNSRLKSFIYGAFSGIVEPIAGLITALVASYVISIMPWMLSFAAGAMIYVIFEELVPEAHGKTKIGTMGAMIGFLVMMILDVAL